MDKVNYICSKVVPLQMKDVDTDLIIPAQFLTSISRDGYGENLFRRLKDNDANFPLNQEKYTGARILVADSNFGCGSSREHAVWALVGAGFKAVIAKSFADIFYSNAAKNGLLLVTLPDKVVDRMLSEASDEDYVVSIDLESQTVLLPDSNSPWVRSHGHWNVAMPTTSYPFEYDSFRKYCMLNGLDDVDYILSHKKEFDEFKQKQKAQQPLPFVRAWDSCRPADARNN